MQDLPAIYWIPKMHKNPVSFSFIIVSQVCSIKPLSSERYHTKGKIRKSERLFGLYRIAAL